MKKFVTIVLALVVSFFTNVKAQDVQKVNLSPIGKYAEPTGGLAELKKGEGGAELRFVLHNGTTPGDWKVKEMDDKAGFVFLEGPFKDQVYRFSLNAEKTKYKLTEQGGRKTVWTQQ